MCYKKQNQIKINNNLSSRQTFQQECVQDLGLGQTNLKLCNTII